MTARERVEKIELLIADMNHHSEMHKAIKDRCRELSVGENHEWVWTIHQAEAALKAAKIAAFDELRQESKLKS